MLGYQLMQREAPGSGFSNVEQGAPPDPLSTFAAAHRHGLPAKRAGKRFNSGEHAWLAGRGAKQALEELNRQRGIELDAGLFTEIPRASERDTFEYGELVALSGDFYGSPDKLFDEKPSPVPWLWEGNDLSDLRQLFGKELAWIETRNRGRAENEYPESNVRMAWNAKSYTELALRNEAHFGWHNARTYCTHHATALQMASDCRGRNDMQFWRAVCTNAFADHFLTDGFAAGHVRVPRAEIRSWAARQGLNDKAAGFLSKVLHDQDGHVSLASLHGEGDESARPDEDGLLVKDSNGAEWYTRCDGQLFLRGAAESPAVERAVAAVTASVLELLVAWKLGELPEGVYAATRMIPFPHPNAPTLIQKFPAQMSDSELERLWNSVFWLAKVPVVVGLERKHLRALLDALPTIMDELRNSVAKDVAQEADVKERLAPEYSSAYLRIA